MPNSLLVIDPQIVADNWTRVAATVAPASCAAVVKADAYGIGIGRVAAALSRVGCRAYFVSSLSEARKLRSCLNEDIEIFVLHGIDRLALREYFDLNLTPAATSISQLSYWLAVTAATLDTPIALQVDSGLARIGIPLVTLLGSDCIATLRQRRNVTVLSHLVSAELTEDALNMTQLAAMHQLRSALPSARFSLANSAGTALGEPYRLDMVRVGAALYGAHFESNLFDDQVLPLKLLARIIQISVLDKNQGVGYNHTWRCPTTGFRIATLAIGYSGGLPMSLSEGGALPVAGNLCAVIGQVSMDSVTVDANELPPDKLRPGDFIEIIRDIQDLRQLAQQTVTLPTDLMFRICAGNHERRYVETKS